MIVGANSGGSKRWAACVGLWVGVGLLSGCTSFPEWIHNGFKVGPTTRSPVAVTAK